VARLVADHFHTPQSLAEFPNVDGVVALTHKSGCGIGETGDTINLMRRTLAGYARHPNLEGRRHRVGMRRAGDDQPAYQERRARKFLPHHDRNRPDDWSWIDSPPG
jgi:hypothetical protein